MKHLFLNLSIILSITFSLFSCGNNEKHLENSSIEEKMKTLTIKELREDIKSKDEVTSIIKRMNENPTKYGYMKLEIQKDDFPDIDTFDVYIRKLNNGEDFLFKRKDSNQIMKSTKGASTNVVVRSTVCVCSGMASNYCPDVFNDNCDHSCNTTTIGIGTINLQYVSSGGGTNVSGCLGGFAVEYGQFVVDYDPGPVLEAISSVPDQWIQ